MRNHTMSCDYSEGCSCGASEWNRLEQSRDAALAANEALVKERDEWKRALESSTTEKIHSPTEAKAVIEALHTLYLTSDIDRSQLRSNITGCNNIAELLLGHHPKTDKPFGEVAGMVNELRSQLEATERHLTVAREERTSAQNDAAALRDQLEASQAECERLRKDGERLDWISSEGSSLYYWTVVKEESKHWQIIPGGLGHYENPRAAIDSAMTSK